MKKMAWLAIAGLGSGIAGISLITCVGDAPVVASADGGACAARTASDASGIFVNINGVDSAQCGGAASPCQTVQAGLNQAKVLNKTTVYVARGTYKESLTLSAGQTIEGGWDTLSGKWIPACGADQVSAVKLQMPDSAHVVVTADFTGAATLRNLTVLGKSASAGPAESVYGVFAKSCNLAFESVTVTVGPAGAGADGDAGAPGSTGNAKCSTGNGAVGGAGAPGVGADAGAFGPTGYVPVGGAAGLGDGTPGFPGTCVASCGTSEFTICEEGIANCSASQGCANKLAGCGGTPGSGGAGGAGGGSSIAVFGWDATFTISGGSFSGGNGGNGGKGGAGGGGGVGGSGTTELEGCASCTGNTCATVGNTTLATGGLGGSGGAGGAGGGGAGGSSIGVYAGGPQGKIKIVTAPLYQHGTAGSGGLPNGPGGQVADRSPP